MFFIFIWLNRYPNQTDIKTKLSFIFQDGGRSTLGSNFKLMPVLVLLFALTSYKTLILVTNPQWSVLHPQLNKLEWFEFCCTYSHALAYFKLKCVDVKLFLVIDFLQDTLSHMLMFGVWTALAYKAVVTLCLAVVTLQIYLGVTALIEKYWKRLFRNLFLVKLFPSLAPKNLKVHLNSPELFNMREKVEPRLLNF